MQVWSEHCIQDCIRQAKCQPIHENRKHYQLLPSFHPCLQNPDHRYLSLPLARNSYQRWLLTDVLAKRGFVAKAGYVKEVSCCDMGDHTDQ